MMKSKKAKVLALVLCAALLVGGSVMATLAYLMDSEEVVNTFTVGQVGITLDEAKVTPEGELDGTDRVQGNNYHLIPGQSYIKDPMITLDAGSEASYVRMMVTLNKAAVLKETFGADFLPQNYVDGWDAAVWPCVGVTEDGDTITYEFRYSQITEKVSTATPLEPLFTEFTLPGTVNGTQLNALMGADGEESFKITVVGHAIQAAGFNNADAAWAAFDQQYALENTVTP